MGRAVNTAWYAIYSQVKEAMNGGLADGKSRTEIVEQLANELGYARQTLERILKIGRFLESQLPDLMPKEVHCAYTQVELVQKLTRINASMAQELLPKVLRNVVSVNELKALYAEQTQLSPVASAMASRFGSRQQAAAHEREASAAIIREGARFFGFSAGRLLKQTKKPLFTSPQFIVLNEGMHVADVYVRVGGDSKDTRSHAFELLDVALARHGNGGQQVWFVLPVNSTLKSTLMTMAAALKISPKDKGWLYVAQYDHAEDELSVTAPKFYLSNLMFEYIENGQEDFKWEGVDTESGARHRIPYFRLAR